MNNAQTEFELQQMSKVDQGETEKIKSAYGPIALCQIFQAQRTQR